MLRSYLCYYSDACIVVKETTTVTRASVNVYEKKLVFKNNAFINAFQKLIIHLLTMRKA